MTVELESTTEEEANNIDFVDLCEELEALEKRVNMQSQHIQQVKLETTGEDIQSREQLEGAGSAPSELIEVKL
jgi:hypothetical protein